MTTQAKVVSTQFLSCGSHESSCGLFVALHAAADSSEEISMAGGRHACLAFEFRLTPTAEPPLLVSLNLEAPEEDVIVTLTQTAGVERKG